MSLSEIRRRTNYNIAYYKKKPVVIYDSHRCIIPTLWLSAFEGFFEKPYDIVFFDRHADTRKPLDATINSIKELINNGPNFYDIYSLAEFKLNSINDDWLFSAMEMGLIENAVLIGGSENSPLPYNTYTDHTHKIHNIYNIPCLSGAFYYQGDFSDLARKCELQALWDIIGWEIHNGHFQMNDKPILLDFDLDFFTFKWRSITKAWLHEFFNEEFGLSNQHPPVDGWSGQLFVKSLVNKAPLITIAKETSICGGEQEVSDILNELNSFIFEDQVDF